MQVTRWVFVVLVAAALAACGGKESGKSGSASPGGSSATPKGNATAEEVAEQARGDVDCPAKVTTAPRDPKAAVDDVVGVRPGLTYDEAANLVMCTNKLMVVRPDPSRGVQIQTYGQTIRQGFTARFAEPRVEKTSKQIMQEMQDDMIARSGNAVRHDMKPGQVKWFVGTMGVPGQERVIAAAREEWFEEGHNPTTASVEQALTAKYGAPPTRTQRSSGRVYLTWAYDPLQRPITETSPLYNRCSGNADPDGGVSYSPDCGIVIAAIVAPLPDNQALSQFIQVGVVNQAGGYEAANATEQTFQKMDAQKKAQQVEAASKDAAKPQL